VICKLLSSFDTIFCDPAGIRTQDHYIKSVMLYQLSYGIIFLFEEVQRYKFYSIDHYKYQKTINYRKSALCGVKTSINMPGLVQTTP
jgi:hypothetical protein